MISFCATSLLLSLYCMSLIYGQSLDVPDITCTNVTNSCLISCKHNNSCSDLDIISNAFLQQKQKYDFINNLSSLSMECLAEAACHDITINCNNFGVENCTVACLNDDSCVNITLLCGRRSLQNKLKQCFLYTTHSDSAIQFSLVNCNYSIETNTNMFCGYKCGLESDGCYEDNICLDNGYDTNCSCKGLAAACDEIFFESTVLTTMPQSTNIRNTERAPSIFDNLTDEILIFIGIGLCAMCIALFLLVCCCKIRIKNSKIYKNITEEYSINNLKYGLLRNDTLSNTLIENKTYQNESHSENQHSVISYDDNAVLGSFRLVPDAELGDSLFNNLVVDESDDAFL